MILYTVHLVQMEEKNNIHINRKFDLQKKKKKRKKEKKIFTFYNEIDQTDV